MNQTHNQRVVIDYPKAFLSKMRISGPKLYLWVQKPLETFFISDNLVLRHSVSHAPHKLQKIAC